MLEAFRLFVILALLLSSFVNLDNFLELTESYFAQLRRNLMMSTNMDSIPGLGRCPGEGKGYPLQFSGHGVYSPWGHKWLDTTERLSCSHTSHSGS